MKVGLILSSDLALNPYVSIYAKLLDELSVEYDIVTWNRYGLDDGDKLSYNVLMKNESSTISKIIKYCSFCRFAIHIIKKKKYDCLVVFSPQLCMALYWFLKKHYAGRFVMDYRDLSIEQKNMWLFKKVLDCSGLNVISSPGFKTYLPSAYEYTLSHNFDVEKLNNLHHTSACDQLFDRNKIEILTIGAIRDYAQNKEIVNALKNKSPYHMTFVGSGDAAALLDDYVAQDGIINVYFSGYYEKKDEEKFILNSDFINIYYPNIASHISALSNRFYNSLLYKRPMIVLSTSIQGEYVNKYGLGISIDNCDQLNAKIDDYILHFNYTEFEQNANLLLEEFRNDYVIFKQKFIEFLNKEHDV
ncbi:MAG: capsular biosynthesis protein [Muribaculaceae bacterium]